MDIYTNIKLRQDKYYLILLQSINNNNYTLQEALKIYKSSNDLKYPLFIYIYPKSNLDDILKLIELGAKDFNNALYYLSFDFNINIYNILEKHITSIDRGLIGSCINNNIEMSVLLFEKFKYQYLFNNFNMKKVISLLNNVIKSKNIIIIDIVINTLNNIDRNITICINIKINSFILNYNKLNEFILKHDINSEISSDDKYKNRDILDYGLKSIENIYNNNNNKDIFIKKLFGLRSPIKELTENYGIIYNLFKQIDYKFIDDNNIMCVCVGDGKRFMCGQILSSITNWNIISVDPIIDKSRNLIGKNNLICIKII